MNKTVEIKVLDEQLQKVIKKVKNPNHGVFGPDSLIWKINRERIILMGGGRALLLQFAHPGVAAGVLQHSNFKSDFTGRYQRTFNTVRGMVFGDLKTALKYARAVHNLHKKVSGTTDDNKFYMANNEDVLLWVHSTLWDTSVKIYEMFIRKLSDEELEQYYQETKFFAYLFGISDETLPETWNDFKNYTKFMCDGFNSGLKINKSALELSEYIFNPNFILKIPGNFYKAFTTQILPEPVRKLYQLELNFKQKIMFSSIYKTIKYTNKILPEKLKYVSEYHQALKRIKADKPVDYDNNI